MMSPLRSSLKKPSERVVIFLYSWFLMSLTTPVRMGMMAAEARK